MNCTSIGISASEFLSLQSLYNSTNGTSWAWNPSSLYSQWNFSALSTPLSFEDLTRPCGNNVFPKWQGLTCEYNLTLSHCSVSKLQLVDYELTGYLPTELSQLPSLQYLDLHHNFIGGTIPVSIGHLSHLNYLDLSDNLFSKTIPTEVNHLTKLQSLTLSYNFFTGSFPNDTVLPTSLVSLDFTLNSFSGPIPPSLGNLTNLHTLLIGFNHLTSSLPSELGRISSLSIFNVSNNDLTGSVPSSFSNMTSLTILYLIQNSLSGTLPSELGSLTNLEVLTFYSNHIHGTIPSTYSFPLVQSLSVSSNHLTGSLPSSFGNMSSIIYLSCFGNYFTSSIPIELSHAKALQFLRLHQNYLTGTLSSSLAALTGLGFFQINNNYLSGTIPSEFTVFRSMQFIDFSVNFLSGLLPSALGDLSKLATLNLFNNQFSGSIPRTFQDLVSLNLFALQFNSLTGDLSQLFSSMVSLKDVFLFHNSFSGPIPSALFSLPAIETLVISSNCFSGPFPSCSSFNYSRSLKVVSASDLSSGSNCRIYPIPASLSFGLSLGFAPKSLIPGGVPTCMFFLPQLNSLYLSGNGLTGPLNLANSHHQAWDCATSSMRSLTLSANRLTGSIPSSLQRCGILTWLDLSLNRFSGTLESDYNPQTRSLSLSSGDLGVSAQQSYLSLSVNRLTGPLPTSSNFTLLGDQMISDVMVGNSFEFSAPQISGHMSESGEERLGYLNGSSSLNQGLEISFIVFLFFVLSRVLWRPLFEHLEKRANRINHDTPSPSEPTKPSSLTLVLADPRLKILALLRELFPTYDHPSESLFTAIDTLFAPDHSSDQQQMIQSQMTSLLSPYSSSDPSPSLSDPSPPHTTSSMKPIPSSNSLSSFPAASCQFSTEYRLALLIGATIRTRTGLHLLPHLIWLQSFPVLLSTLLVVFLALLFKTQPTLSALFSTHQFQYAWVVSSAYLHGWVPVLCLSLVVFSSLLLSVRYVQVNEHRSQSLVQTRLRSQLKKEGGQFSLSTTSSSLSSSSHSPSSQNPINSTDISHNINDSNSNSNSNVSNRNDNHPSSPSTSLVAYHFLRSILLSIRSFLSPSAWSLWLSRLPQYRWQYSLKSTCGMVGLLLVDVSFMLLINAIYLRVVLTQGRNVGVFQFFLGLFKTMFNGWMMFLGKRIINNFSQWWWFGTFILTFNMLVTPFLSTILTESSCLFPLFHQQALPALHIQYHFCTLYSYLLHPFRLICVTPGYQSVQIPAIPPPFIYNYQCASALVVDYTPVLIYSTLFSKVAWPVILLAFGFLKEMGHIDRWKQWVVDNPLSLSLLILRKSSLPLSPSISSSTSLSLSPSQSASRDGQKNPIIEMESLRQAPSISPSLSPSLSLNPIHSSPSRQSPLPLPSLIPRSPSKSLLSPMYPLSPLSMDGIGVNLSQIQDNPSPSPSPSSPPSSLPTQLPPQSPPSSPTKPSSPSSSSYLSSANLRLNLENLEVGGGEARREGEGGREGRREEGGMFEGSSEEGWFRSMERRKLLHSLRFKLFSIVQLTNSSFVDLLLLLTFGLSCPYLGWIIILSSIFRMKTYLWRMKRYELLSMLPRPRGGRGEREDEGGGGEGWDSPFRMTMTHSLSSSSLGFSSSSSGSLVDLDSSSSPSPSSPDPDAILPPSPKPLNPSSPSSLTRPSSLTLAFPSFSPSFSQDRLTQAQVRTKLKNAYNSSTTTFSILSYFVLSGLMSERDIVSEREGLTEDSSLKNIPEEPPSSLPPLSPLPLSVSLHYLEEFFGGFHYASYLPVSLSILIFVTSLYWSFQFFDMVGDRFGIRPALITLLLVLGVMGVMGSWGLARLQEVMTQIHEEKGEGN